MCKRVCVTTPSCSKTNFWQSALCNCITSSWIIFHWVNHSGSDTHNGLCRTVEGVGEDSLHISAIIRLKNAPDFHNSISGHSLFQERPQNKAFPHLFCVVAFVTFVFVDSYMLLLLLGSWFDFVKYFCTTNTSNSESSDRQLTEIVCSALATWYESLNMCSLLTYDRVQWTNI